MYDDVLNHVHRCEFNTAGVCPVCGLSVVLGGSTTIPLAAQVVLSDDRVNMGSPIGPGYVVYERAKGVHGYDRKMALDSVGKGWHVLINAVFDRIEWDQKHHQGRFLGSLVVTQVKEKFGTLRMYHYCDNDPGYADGYMSAIESLSGKICEDCGKPGTTGGRGWIRTMCEECRAECNRRKVTRLRDPGTEQTPDA
jgi:hypothetical protein